MAKLGISTVTLTDELIEKFSADRVVTNGGDINLRVDKIYEPVVGGLYDSNYFGSVLLDVCNCKAVRKLNTYCPSCGSTPLDEDTRNSRFARMELPWFYVPHFKMKGIETYLVTNFILQFDFQELTEISGKGKLQKALDLAQIEVLTEESKDKPIIRFHDQYTDLGRVSYEGLLLGLKELNLNKEASDLKVFIDKYVLIIPASMRGVKITTIAGQRQLTLPKPTAIYKSIFMALDQIANNTNARDLVEEIIIRGVFRNYVRKSLLELSEFTKSSKENLGRQMFSARVPNTFRSVITAGPELKIDEISIPIQNAYGILKDRYLDYLMSERNIPYYRALEIYTKGDSDTLDEFSSWVTKESPVVIMVRQPTLHRYSMMAFTFKVHKGHDMKLPLEICGPFGGDFDGDQMACFLIPEEHKEEVINKMSPTKLKFYDKNMKPLAVPSHGIMHGYIGCTTPNLELGRKGKRIVDTLEELESLYDKEEVELQELVYLNGKPTTFGRAKIEDILGTTINKALGYAEEVPLIPVDNKNIDEFMKYITLLDNSGEVTRDIRIFVMEMSTLEGFSSLSLDQLHVDVPKELKDELSAIREDNSLDGIQKFVRVTEVNSRIKKWVEKNMDPDLKQTMINSNRMKISALMEMTLPQATVDDDGRILSNENSLYESLNEEEYRAHSLQNRSILELKQNLVPRSGYLNRQLYFLGQGLEYHKELRDESNIGIELPRNKAEGRTMLNGKLVPKSDSSDLVRVRSIAVTDKDYASPDQISVVTFPPESTTSAFGLRVSTTLTESFTQAGLSLKHSGSFVQVPTQNQLKHRGNSKGSVKLNPENKTIEIVNKSGEVLDTYPLPNNFDIIHTEVETGTHIGTTLATASAGLNLDTMIAVMKARKAKPDQGLAKNTIKLMNCYAPVTGKIHYDFNKGVYLIGKVMMGPIHPEAVYYFPEGYEVTKFTRVMSFPLDVSWYLDMKFPIDEVYQMFRIEFRTLTGMKDLTEELLEVLFHLLTKKDFKSGLHTYLGSNRGITKGNNSFFSQLSFERGKSAISRLASGELKFENDVFTRNILDHLIISAKDKTM